MGQSPIVAAAPPGQNPVLYGIAGGRRVGDRQRLRIGVDAPGERQGAIEGVLLDGQRAAILAMQQQDQLFGEGRHDAGTSKPS